MLRFSSVRGSFVILAAVFYLGAAVGCNSQSSPTSPPLLDAPGGSVFVGTESTAVIDGQLSGVAASSSVAGINVGVDGTTLASSTDSQGRFRFLNVPSGNLVLHLSGGGISAAVSVSSVAANQHLQITVQVDAGSAQLVQDVRDEIDEFEGAVTGVDAAGVAFTLAGGKTIHVDAATMWDAEGDVLSFDALVTAHADGLHIKAEGKFIETIDGLLLATVLKIETEDKKDDGPDAEEREFAGIVASVDLLARTLKLDDGTLILVDAATIWKNKGHESLLSLEEVADALAAGRVVEAEGEGEVQDDGAILAAWVKAEAEEEEVEEAEFEGFVTTADVAAGFLVLHDGTRVAIDGDTIWKNKGHEPLHSLQEIADMLAAARKVEAEGKGTVQDDGSILAAVIKVQAEKEEVEEAEFEGEVASVDLAAGSMKLHSGATVFVDHETVWKDSGDNPVHSLEEIAAVLATGNAVWVAGKGTVQPDGGILADWIKSEAEEEDPDHAFDDVIDEIEELIDYIEHWTKEGSINKADADVLIGKLEYTIDRLEDGDAAAALAKLDFFIDHVKWLFDNGKLIESCANSMIEAATKIKAMLS